MSDPSSSDVDPFGGPPTPPIPPRAVKKEDPLAITSLITGVISIPCMGCCFYIGLPLGVTAMITGGMSISRQNKAPEQWSGRGLAIGGLICGCISFALFILLIAVGILGAGIEAINSRGV